VSKSSLDSIVLDIPPLPEQLAIASILTTSNDELCALEAKADALERQKKGLMQKLLTGKMRVKTAIML
jgi:type I restriction enzyme S subunit